MEEFKQRRAKLAQQMVNGSIALLNGAKLQIRNNDVEFPFRQDSNMYYLTGFCEPEALMVLCKDAQGKHKYILFNQASNPDMEVWNGRRAGQQGACEQFGADEAYDVEKIDEILPKLLENTQTIYYPLSENKDFDQLISKWLRVLKRRAPRVGVISPDRFVDLLPLIHEMRLFKSQQEIEYMRKAATVSAAAHLKLMQKCTAGDVEYQLEALFSYDCLYAGCRGLAYGSIVAGGNNACTLHYTTNDQILKDGDLVLIDAGAEYNNYAADITRTFPVNGKFSPEQKQIYAIVLNAQLAAIEKVRPGAIWQDLEDTVTKVIVSGLVELGILKGSVEQLIKDKAYKQFYMHSCGHWLGLDVHDVGKYRINGEARKFEAGMVLTVEPGIYIDQKSGAPKKWLGIGVRIEDDVLVTATGHDVLSKDAPKQIDEIERAAI